MKVISGVICLAAAVAAQDVAGFRGTIRDSSGSGVPNVTVSVEEESTRLRRVAASNAEGEFEIRSLGRGTYTISAEAPSFRRFVNSGLVLYPGQVRRVDIRLELGDVSQSIEVTGEGAVIEADQATVSYKQAKTEIYHLNRQTAGWLVYTIENHPGQQVRSQVHGSYANGLQAVQDGIGLMGYSQQGRLPQEVVQDISQVSLNAPAEYQHATTVVGTGRQGGNRFHGEVFLEVRNIALNALPVGQTNRLPGKPTTQWSYDASGPLRLPKLYDGRNKTFFRFLYQPGSIRTIETLDGFDAPPQALRDGDLSSIAALIRRPVNDPFNGQPFPGNIIPRSRFSQVAINTFPLIPLPNFGPADGLADNYRFFNDYNESRAWHHYRLDHQIGKSNTITVTHLRFFRDTTHTADDSPFNNNIDRTAQTRAWSVRDTHVFNPRVTNEFSFAYNLQEQVSRNGLVKGADYLRQLGIGTGGRRLPDALGSPLLNLQTFRSNRNTSIIGGRSAQESSITDASVVTFRNAISVFRGRHLFKAGADLNWQRPYSDSIAAGTFGTLNYTGNFTNSDWADFLLGLPFTTSIALPRPRLESRHIELGWFAQDDWKVNSRLTLTPGLRMQRYGVPVDRTGLYYNFDVASRRVVVPDRAALERVSPAYPREIPVVTAADAGYPGRLAEFKSVLFEPRIGLAWRPMGPGFVIRSGYGIFHVPYSRPQAASAGELLPGRTGGPFALTESFGPNRITGGRADLTSSLPFPTGPGASGLQNVTAMPADLRRDRWPYDQQWNLTLEKALPLAIGVRATYVGSKGTQWPYVADLQIPRVSGERFTAARRPFGAAPYQSVFVNQLGGNSTYHGTEFEVNRQFSSGLYLRAWYDYRRSLNDVDGGTFGSAEGSRPEDPYNRSREKGVQDGMIAHSARFTAVYEIPAKVNGWRRHVLGGWTLAPFLTIRSGLAFTPTFSGVDTANTGRATGRPDSLCNGNGAGAAPGRTWNPACFAVPANGSYGTASRGSLYGPNVWTTAFNVFKNWKLATGENAPYLRLEMYANNVFNHSNADTLSSNNIRAAGFGEFRVTGVDTRVIYFRLRLGL